MIQETFTSHGDAKSIITKSNDEQLLDMAWEWLCRARKNAPPSADIWDLRLHWPQQRDGLLTQLKAGRYRLSAMWVVGKKKQVMWTARDALVLKWVALKLAGRLPLHPRCEHVKGHGGGAASLRLLNEVVRSGDYPWVCRTDIKGYYGAIQKPFLLEQLRQQRLAPEVLYLLEQYLHYSVESGGEFHTPERGIPCGCALSPLMGALHLWAVDNHFARQPGIYYARYMDDFVILTKTRWQLRRQVASLNRFFNVYGFRQHPDKTFIGRTAKGFDWMGAQLGASGVTGVAPRALANHWAKVRRLYEQTWLSRITRQAKVSVYRARWMKWAIVALGVHAGSAGAVAVGEGLSGVLATLTPPRGGGHEDGIDRGPGSDAIVWGGAVWVGDGPASAVYCTDYASAFARYPLATVDGYQGIQLAPGAILVLTGHIRTRSYYDTWRGIWVGETVTVDTTFDSRGFVSGSPNVSGNGVCVTNAPRFTENNIAHLSALAHDVRLDARVYVRPGTAAFTTNVPLSFNNVLRGAMTVPLDIRFAGTSCTLRTPTSVAFGEVRPGEARYHREDLVVACTGGGPLPIVIRATTAHMAANAVGTVLSNDASGKRVGVVTGYWGTEVPVGCVASPDTIYTDGRGSFATIPASPEGAEKRYKLTWALCPDRGAVPGPASGRVSLEVTW